MYKNVVSEWFIERNGEECKNDVCILVWVGSCRQKKEQIESEKKNENASPLLFSLVTKMVKNCITLHACTDTQTKLTAYGY